MQLFMLVDTPIQIGRKSKLYVHTCIHTLTHTYSTYGSITVTKGLKDLEQAIYKQYTKSVQCKILQTFYKTVLQIIFTHKKFTNKYTVKGAYFSICLWIL
jgi:hypothetical protein